jgi:hypothetical protein
MFAEGFAYGRLIGIGVIVLIIVLVTWAVKTFVANDD